MDQPPPLSPEEVSKLADEEYAQLGQPQTVKVFGILHVIFASFGIISVIIAIINTSIGGTLFAFGSEAATAQMQAQVDMQEKLLPVTVISTILSAVIATLMLYAGILMLKKRRSALSWSNRYAWTSLAGKVVALILAFMFTLPATSEMMEASGSPSSPVPLDTIMIASTVVGVLIYSIYPILTLVLLNRPKTKAWFANQPL